MPAWLERLITPRQAPAAARARAPLAPGVLAEPVVAGHAPEDAARQPGAAPPVIEQTSLDLAFLAWMANSPALEIAPAGLREREVVQQLDRLIADKASHARLLPRAAAVIPPLLARLRNPALSLPELAQHVSRDVTLVAEVIRLANSPYYRREAVVADLDHAIRVLGVEGLRSAIMRALLKPLIDARGGKLVVSSAARLWEHSDKKSQLCSALARSHGFEPFDGCLAGLAHNVVWSAVLRVMDEVDGDLAWRLSPGFVTALRTRRDRLFAIVARQWLLPDPAAVAAAASAQPGQRGHASTLLELVYAADHLAWQLCNPDRSQAAAISEALLRDADKAVRACYQGLEQASAAAPPSAH